MLRNFLPPPPLHSGLATHNTINSNNFYEIARPFSPTQWLRSLWTVPTF
jgi:hypothetical protein